MCLLWELVGWEGWGGAAVLLALRFQLLHLEVEVHAGYCWLGSCSS